MSLSAYGSRAAERSLRERLAGSAAAAAITLAVGLGLGSGLGVRFVEVAPPPTVMVTLPTPTVRSDPPPTFGPASPTATTPLPRPDTVAPRLPTIDYDDPPPVAPATPLGSAGAGTGTEAPPAGLRTWPLLSDRTATPDYPATAIRGRQEGTTSLDLCVEADGRVSAATLAQSSGYRALDEAALRWVRSLRLKPGAMDGKPAAMCGFQLTYQWVLKDR